MQLDTPPHLDVPVQQVEVVHVRHCRHHLGKQLGGLCAWEGGGGTRNKRETEGRWDRKDIKRHACSSEMSAAYSGGCRMPGWTVNSKRADDLT